MRQSRAEIVSVLDLFKGSIFWEIPQYQRIYEWGPQQVERLLSDVWRCHLQNREEKFLGALLSFNDPSRGLLVHEVVDGQQRLITLMLVLRAAAYVSKQHTISADIVDPESAKAATTIEQLTSNLYRTDADRENSPLLGLFDQNLRAWFKDVFLQKDHRCLANYVMEELKTEITDKNKRVRGYFIESFKLAQAFFKRQCKEGGLPQLASFVEYLMYKTRINHTTTHDIRTAFDQFDALNGAGMPLTNQQKMKSYLMLDSANTNNELYSEAWCEAEKLLGCEQCGDGPRSREPLEHLLTTVACMAQAEQNPSDPQMIENWNEYFLDKLAFRVGDESATGKSVRLFNAGLPERAAVAVLFGQHLSAESVSLFCSLTKIGKDFSGDLLDGIQFSRADCNQLTRSVQLLKLLYHFGLDQLWVPVAYAFCHRVQYGGATGGAGGPKVKNSSSQCATTGEHVLFFFKGLERLAAYILFAAPRTKRTGRKAARVEYSEDWPEEEQLHYLRTVQESYYQDILLHISSQAPIQDVVGKLTLSTDEAGLFKKEFPSRFPELQWRKRAIYVLVRAELPLEDSFHTFLDELRLKSSPGMYGQPRLSTVVPRQDDNMRSGTSWSVQGWEGNDTHGHLKLSLGNMVVTTSEDKSNRFMIDWKEKRLRYAKETLDLTKSVAELPDFKPVRCKDRDRHIRERLERAWDVGLQTVLCYGKRDATAVANAGVAQPKPKGSVVHGLTGWSDWIDWSDWRDLDEPWVVQRIRDHLRAYGPRHFTQIGGLFKVKHAFLRRYFDFDEYSYVYPREQPSRHDWNESAHWVRDVDSGRTHNGRKRPYVAEENANGAGRAELSDRVRKRKERFGT